jgi:hypothetical protein
MVSALQYQPQINADLRKLKKLNELLFPEIDLICVHLRLSAAET